MSGGRWEGQLSLRLVPPRVCLLFSTQRDLEGRVDREGGRVLSIMERVGTSGYWGWRGEAAIVGRGQGGG